jgi:hypothetical protein
MTGRVREYNRECELAQNTLHAFMGFHMKLSVLLTNPKLKKIIILGPSVWIHFYNPSIRKLKEEDFELVSILGYLMRACLKNNETKIQLISYISFMSVTAKEIL